VRVPAAESTVPAESREDGYAAASVTDDDGADAAASTGAAGDELPLHASAPVVAALAASRPMAARHTTGWSRFRRDT